MQHLFSIGLCLTVIALPHSVLGQAENSAGSREQARQLYTKATDHFAAKRYGEALAAFTEVYNLSAKPEVLYNLGLCAEKLGDRERAIAYFELYLEELPDADDAAEVRAHLRHLNNEPAPEQPPPDPAPAVAPPPDAAMEEAPPIATLDRESLEPIDDEMFTDEEPQQGVFWPGVTLGVGGLLLGGGIVTAILAHKKYNDLEVSCSPDCTDDDISTAHSLAIASDIQFATGAAAAITGIFLWVFRKKVPSEHSIAISASTTKTGSQGAQLMINGRF